MTPSLGLPHAPEVEHTVLGAALRGDEEASAYVAGELSGADFYSPTNRYVYEALRHLVANATPVDVATVAAQLESEGRLNVVGGRAALVGIADTVFTTAMVKDHARILQEKSALRRLISVCDETSGVCRTNPGDVADLLTKHEAQVEAIISHRRQDTQKDSYALMKGAIDGMYAYRDHGISRVAVPTTYPRLDGILGGFHKGDLIIVAARPSIGKTALGMNLAIRLSRQDVGVGFFSLEMSSEAIGERVISYLSSVNSLSMRNGRLATDEFSRAETQAQEFADKTFIIDDQAGLSVLDFRNRARRMVAKSHIKCIFVDYLQLMHGTGHNREQAVADVSRSLKAVAKELSVPVVAMAQLNRTVEGRSDRRPQLADLRESGGIEQDADVVLLLHRPEYYGLKSDADGDAVNRMDVIVGKQRNGPTGVVHLRFDRTTGRIGSWEGQVDDWAQSQESGHSVGNRKAVLGHG